MKVFCILSDERVFRSKSPAIFSHVFKRLGIDSIYIPFKVMPEDIGSAMQSLKTLNIDGANITVPYKESVMPYMNILSEGAKIVGAVNTIIRNGNELKGYNTNAIGFMHTLEEAGFDVADKTALVFGTGGLARAVVFILNWLSAGSLTIAGRTTEHINRITKKSGGVAKLINTFDDRPFSANIVVNTTSVSSEEESPEFARIISKLDLKDCELILDFNYGRKNNFWRTMAEKKGIRFINGFTPLAHSARQILLLWTKIDAGPEEFMNAIKENIQDHK